MPFGQGKGNAQSQNLKYRITQSKAWNIVHVNIYNKLKANMSLYEKGQYVNSSWKSERVSQTLIFVNLKRL